MRAKQNDAPEAVKLSKFVVWFYFGAQKSDIGYPFESENLTTAIAHAKDLLAGGKYFEFTPSTTGGFASVRADAITCYVVESVREGHHLIGKRP